MKKLVMMAVALLSFVAASAQSTGEIIEKYNQGTAALQANQWATALTAFEDVFKGGIDSEDVAKYVDANTCLLSVMSASNISGNIMDMEPLLN